MKRLGVLEDEGSTSDDMLLRYVGFFRGGPLRRRYQGHGGLMRPRQRGFDLSHAGLVGYKLRDQLSSMLCLRFSNRRCVIPIQCLPYLWSGVLDSQGPSVTTVPTHELELLAKSSS
jgi:hypothetical protein